MFLVLTTLGLVVDRGEDTVRVYADEAGEVAACDVDVNFELDADFDVEVATGVDTKIPSCAPALKPAVRL